MKAIYENLPGCKSAVKSRFFQICALSSDAVIIILLGEKLHVNGIRNWKVWKFIMLIYEQSQGLDLQLSCFSISLNKASSAVNLFISQYEVMMSFHYHGYFYFSLLVLGIDPRAFAELHPSPFYFETVSHEVPQTGLNLRFSCISFPGCWEYMHSLPHPAFFFISYLICVRDTRL